MTLNSGLNELYYLLHVVGIRRDSDHTDRAAEQCVRQELLSNE